MSINKRKQAILTQYGFEPVRDSDISPYKIKLDVANYEQKFELIGGQIVIAYITAQTILELTEIQLEQAAQSVVTNAKHAQELIYLDNLRYLQ